MNTNIDKIGMNTKNKKATLFTSIVHICILLFPVLQIYALNGQISLDMFTVAFLFVLYFLRGGHIKIVPKYLALYLTYSYLVSAFSMNGIQSFIPFGLFMSIMAIIVFWGTFEYESLMKIYRVLAIVCVSFFFLQEFTYYTTGIRVSGILPYLPLAISDDYSNWLMAHNSALRSSSIFSEPAHFAQFLLPIFCVELFSNNYKYKKVLLMLMAVALLLSQSGNAIFGLALIVISYVWYLIIGGKTSSKRIVIVLMLFGFAIGFGYYTQTEMGQNLLNRQSEITELSTNKVASSEYMRLFRGYDLYGEMPVINKIFGIGDKDNLMALILHSKISFLFHENDTYLNGLSAVLIHCGMVGVTLIFMLLSSFWKDNTYTGKVLLLLLVLMMLISSTYLNSLFNLLLLMAYGEKNNNMSCQQLL